MTESYTDVRQYFHVGTGGGAVSGTERMNSMSEELKKEQKSEDLTKTTEAQDIELPEEDKDRISGGFFKVD